MTESGKPETLAAPACDGAAPCALIEALRTRGAERFDPAGFRFIEAMARRAAARPPGTRRVIERRLAKAAAEYDERLERAGREARKTVSGARARFPEASDAMTERCDAGDFGGLRRLLARLDAQRGDGRLIGLLARLAPHATDASASAPSTPRGFEAEPQGELKSLTYFRRTWSRLSVDRQLSDAFAQAPENAGPLNSHFLLLQSLRLMRDISPDYLVQFMSYVDALLWLEQADSGSGPARKSAIRSERHKKLKTGRGSAG